MSQRSCPKCGSTLNIDTRFCGNCGTDVSSAGQENTVYPQAVSKLIEIIIMTMRNAPPPEKLKACAEFFEMPAGDSEKAIAWAMKMYCHAQLRQIDETTECQAKAREHYARHLGLPDAQREKYLSDPGSTNPLAFDQRLELRMYTEEPHLVELFDCPELCHPAEGYIGDSIAEKQATALESWAQGVDNHINNQLKFLSLLAFLYLKIGQHRHALSVLENITQKDLFYERLGTPSYKLVWSQVLAGNCHDAIGQLPQAILKWQRVRTYEQMSDAASFSEVLLSFWINQAKNNLLKKGLAIPSFEDTQRAAQHLSRAMQWLLRAESEVEGLDIAGLATKLKDYGENYRAFVMEAANELNFAISLDSFARAELGEDDDSKTWISGDVVKSIISHNRGLIYLAFDNFDPAIAEFRQSLGTKSSLNTTLWLGLAYQLKGSLKEAGEMYQFCITRSDEIADPTEDQETRQIVVETARYFLSELYN